MKFVFTFWHARAARRVQHQTEIAAGQHAIVRYICIVAFMRLDQTLSKRQYQCVATEQTAVDTCIIVNDANWFCLLQNVIDTILWKCRIDR